jgi:lipid-binding SYLF domain-containing protein
MAIVIGRQVRFLAVAFCMMFVARGALAEGLMGRADLDPKVRQAVEDLYKHSSAAKELAGKSHGMLVFPSVIKGGIGIGGEYGEGALLVGGRTADYYNIASASIGFQLGGQVRSVVIMFMTADAFQKFRASSGWKAGVDGSVAIATLGAGGALDTATLQKPIIGFVFENKGLMYNLTLEGSKISKIKQN